MNRPVTLGIGVAVLLLGMGSPGACLAQTAAGVARERSEFAHWLASAPLSPYAMIALQPIGPGISVGPEPADIPLPLSSRGVVREERGVVTLELEGRKLALPRGRPVSVAPYRFLATGPAGRTVLAAYGAVRGVKDPTYFPFAPRFEAIVGLEAPERRIEQLGDRVVGARRERHLHESRGAEVRGLAAQALPQGLPDDPVEGGRPRRGRPSCAPSR